MKTYLVPIGKVKPYEKNNRIHGDQQVDRIARSISEFGFNQPVVVDEKGEILVGHGRLLAAKKLKLKEIPVLVRKDLTEDQKRAYRILDNKLQNDSEWDIGSLEEELKFLEAENFDLEGWGLDDLKKLFPEAEIDDEEEDGLAAIPDSTAIKAGDLIELGVHRVLCGDATKAADIEALLAGESIALMVTDPPYGVSYDPEWREGADLGIGKRSKGKVKNDDRVDWSETFKLFSPQIIYCWHAGKYTAEVSDSLRAAGMEIISQIVWAKQHFVLSRGDYHWQHEPCWYAVRKGAKHNWQGKRDQATLWEIKNNNSFGNADKEETFGHGTQKPIACMARPILNNSKEGERVVDPFLGSGTTLIAAEKFGRVCYGMEIDPLYCQMIIERYKNYCAKNEKVFECKINGQAQG